MDCRHGEAERAALQVKICAGNSGRPLVRTVERAAECPVRRRRDVQLQMQPAEGPKVVTLNRRPLSQGGTGEESCERQQQPASESSPARVVMSPGLRRLQRSTTSRSFTSTVWPGFASTSQHYPVLYLLHGNDQPATAFLEIGLQEQLDQLIARHAIPPLIAVMIQGGPGANNWRNRYERYVLEVQQLGDRMLPTVATRGARAIAGDSMGGYGAMNIALGHPQRFAVVESWLGFFDGLGGELRAARPTIERQGLHAYVYGGASDRIAKPAENAPFAGSDELRAWVVQGLDELR